MNREFTRKDINKIIKYLKNSSEIGYSDIAFLGISKKDIGYSQYYNNGVVEYSIKAKETDFRQVKDIVRFEIDEIEGILTCK